MKATRDCFVAPYGSQCIKPPLVNLTSLFGTISQGPLGPSVSSRYGHDINPLDDVLLARNVKESLFIPLQEQTSKSVRYSQAIQGPVIAPPEAPATLADLVMDEMQDIGPQASYQSIGTQAGASYEERGIQTDEQGNIVPSAPPIQSDLPTIIETRDTLMEDKRQELAATRAEYEQQLAQLRQRLSQESLAKQDRERVIKQLQQVQQEKDDALFGIKRAYEEQIGQLQQDIEYARRNPEVQVVQQPVEVIREIIKEVVRPVVIEDVSAQERVKELETSLGLMNRQTRELEQQVRNKELELKALAQTNRDTNAVKNELIALREQQIQLLQNQLKERQDALSEQNDKIENILGQIDVATNYARQKEIEVQQSEEFARVMQEQNMEKDVSIQQLSIRLQQTENNMRRLEQIAENMFDTNAELNEYGANSTQVITGLQENVNNLTTLLTEMQSDQRARREARIRVSRINQRELDSVQLQLNQARAEIVRLRSMPPNEVRRMTVIQTIMDHTGRAVSQLRDATSFNGQIIHQTIAYYVQETARRTGPRAGASAAQRRGLEPERGQLVRAPRGIGQREPGQRRRPIAAVTNRQRGGEILALGPSQPTARELAFGQPSATETRLVRRAMAQQRAANNLPNPRNRVPALGPAQYSFGQGGRRINFQRQQQ
jgi:hypothetical protein